MSAPTQTTGVDQRLEALAAQLDYPLAARLVELLDASAAIHELVDLRRRLHRAEDLANELRAHLAVRERQLREAQAALR